MHIFLVLLTMFQCLPPSPVGECDKTTLGEEHSMIIHNNDSGSENCSLPSPSHQRRQLNRRKVPSGLELFAERSSDAHILQTLELQCKCSGSGDCESIQWSKSVILSLRQHVYVELQRSERLQLIEKNLRGALRTQLTQSGVEEVVFNGSFSLNGKVVCYQTWMNILAFPISTVAR